MHISRSSDTRASFSSCKTNNQPDCFILEIGAKTSLQTNKNRDNFLTKTNKGYKDNFLTKTNQPYRDDFLTKTK